MDKTGEGFQYKDQSWGERAFTLALYLFMTALVLLFLYPFINILAASFSGTEQVIKGSVTFYPQGFTTMAYESLFQNSEFLISARNTLFYVSVGCVCNLFLVALASYSLAKRRLVFRSFFAIYIAITAFFSGGMIPHFIVVQTVGLYDTWLVFIVLSFYSFGNIIILRTFFQNIPDSYEESAQIDGANDLKILFSIYMPLSKPVLATLSLFIVVAYWNDFFTGLIYLNDTAKYPMQLVLRNFLIENDTTGAVNTREGTTYMEQIYFQIVIKYSSIVVSTLPMVILFLVVQKHFVKGMVIGGIKG
ncbi:MAG: carbohydrate ABC transporter permease [Paenibacillaceae bacterium]|nr:carbohydrate ABC transporter permease [Paenibacillaceae bacterium]